MRPIVRNGIKLGVAVLALEATAHYGLWKDSATASAGFDEAKQSFVGSVVPQFRPYVEKIPFPEVNIPPRKCWREGWNRAIKCTFTTLGSLPQKTGNFMRNSWDSVSKTTVSK